MAPLRKTATNEENDVSTTHHKLEVVQEELEVLNETSATHRAPSTVITEEKEVPPQEPAAVEDEISLRIHEKVASIASKAYRRASAKSNVLSRDKVAGIALVNFEDLTVGELLGKGSFSYVHEITKISSPPNEREDKEHAHDPRSILTANYQREDSKSYRYAVKFLKDSVRDAPEKFAIGTVDLVVEGMFLASLTHPNIIKVRALPEGGVQSLVEHHLNTKGYFLVLDRLFDTLSERIYNKWQDEHCVVGLMSSGCFCLPFGKKYDQAMKEEMKCLGERLKVAFDISAALKFLHSKNIIYRDLKPENLGFDVRGDIKLFDLGLVKELHPADRKNDGNYKLSMAGTPRYMAPECGNYKPYNLSADVYSFSMLLWEIITMRKPLADFTYSRLKFEVFVAGVRPSLTSIHNKNMRELIRMGWHQDASNRPSIDAVYDELKQEYQILQGGTVSEKEMSHDRRRSTFVPSMLSNVNVSKLFRLNSSENVVGGTTRT